MAFKAIGNSFKNILVAPRVYRIPDYQRDFSWDRGDYMVFLQDIISQLIFEKSDDKTSSSSVTFHTQSYYIGSMIFLGSDTDDSVDVIDGQQRFTVTTILLAVLRDLFTEFSTKVNIAKDYSETTQLSYLVKKMDGVTVRKLQTLSSYPYFTKTIQDANYSNDDPGTQEELGLKECYDKMKKYLSQKNILKLFPNYFYADKNLDENYVNFLKAIREQLLASEITEIFVNEKDQAYKIFENINSKGRPLSQVDLIKNDIFSYLASSTTLTNDGPENWQLILDIVSSNTGSINDFFLNYWKAVYPKSLVSGATLYKKYLEIFGNTSDREKYLELLENLRYSAKIYYCITKPNRGDFQRQEKKPQYTALDAISKLNITQIKPLLLTLYLKKDSIKINNTKLNQYMIKISNYQLALLGTDSHIRTNLFTVPYRNASSDINNAKNSVEVFNALDKLMDVFKDNLNKEVFLNAFSELTFTKSSSRKGFTSFPAVYAIRQISNFMNNNNDLNDDALTIEHIFDEKYKTENEKVSNIGNLTVLETYIHDEINKDGIDNYPAKKKYYSESSSVMIDCLLKNPDFTLDNIDNSIDKRGKQLATFYYDNCL
ncbi:DUF262 domain-containing protein [Dellaglioa sp. BT-FLS60]